MSTASERAIDLLIVESQRRLAHSHERIEHCLGQIDDEQAWWRPAESMNSIANLVLHLCGNMGQWIISGIGEAPDVRQRPREFAERGPIPLHQLREQFREVVGRCDAILAGLTAERLLESRRIQGFDTDVLSAMFETLAHLAGHTQEIVYATRIQLGDQYRFAFVPASTEQGAPE